MGAFAFWVFEDRKHSGRIVLCFVGFFVAMVWILMIVNEVVAVLQVRPNRMLTSATRKSLTLWVTRCRQSDTSLVCRMPSWD